MSINSKVKNLKSIAYESVVFAKGYRELQRTNATPARSYYSLRSLYCMTNGRFNDAVSWLLSRRHPAVPMSSGPSVLGDVSDNSVARIVNDIDNDGFHIFSEKLPTETVEKLRIFAQTVPCQAIVVNKPSEGSDFADQLAPYNQHPVPSPKYDVRQGDILGNGTVQELLMDSGIHRVAQGFLRCAPILDLVAMWWSRPFHGKATSEAAQLYHFDMDRIKFLKFFFYLTDVTSNTGPHCYVRGSTKRKPKPLLRDGRILDEEIQRFYAPSDMIEICGGMGSIIAVDTRGWHKGKALTEGERLLLQFEYTNSMFGQYYPKCQLRKDCDPTFRRFVQEHSRMFGGILE